MELELQSLKLDSLEITEHIFEVKTIASKIDPRMWEATLINHLLQGLPTSVKSVLTLFPYSTIKYFDEAVKKYTLRAFNLNQQQLEDTLQNSVLKIRALEEKLNKLE